MARDSDRENDARLLELLSNPDSALYGQAAPAHLNTDYGATVAPNYTPPPPDPGAMSGYEDINGVRYVWHDRANVDRMGSYASIPSAGQFERDGKIYVPESEWVKAHPRQKSWADNLWMLPMAGLGGITAAHALAGGAAGAAGGSTLPESYWSATAGGGAATDAAPAAAGSFNSGNALWNVGPAEVGAFDAAGSIGTGLPMGAAGPATVSNFTIGAGQTAAGALAAAGGAGAGGGFWDNIFKIPQAGTAGNALNSVIGGILESIGQKDLADALRANTTAAANMANVVPQSERDFYQGKQRQLWEDGSTFMQNDAGYQTGVNTLQREKAKLGQIFSGNNATALIDHALSKRNEISSTLSPLGGFQFGPGQAAQIQAQGGADAARANQGVMAGIGYAARPIMNAASNYLSNQVFV